MKFMPSSLLVYGSQVQNLATFSSVAHTMKSSMSEGSRGRREIWDKSTVSSMGSGLQEIIPSMIALKDWVNSSLLKEYWKRDLVVRLFIVLKK